MNSSNNIEEQQKQNLSSVSEQSKEYLTTAELVTISGFPENAFDQQTIEQFGSIKIGRLRYWPKDVINLIENLKKEYYSASEVTAATGIKTQSEFAEFKDCKITILRRNWYRKEVIDIEIAKIKELRIEYYTVDEVREKLSLGAGSGRQKSLLQRLKAIKVHDRLYFPKNLVNAEAEKKYKGIMQEDSKEIPRFYCITQLKQKYGIEYMRINEREKYSAVLCGIYWSYPKDIIEKNLDQLKASLPPIIREDYYTSAEVTAKLGYTKGTKLNINVQLAFKGIDIGICRLFPKSVVHQHTDLFDSAIPLVNLAEKVRLKYKLGIARLNTILAENHIEILNNPISNTAYVQNKNLERIYEICDNDTQDHTPYELYELNKKNFTQQVDLTNTIELLDAFALKRLDQNKNNTGDTRRALCQLYGFIATHLLKELLDVSIDECNLYIQALKNDSTYSKRTATEFASFYNYVKKKHVYKNEKKSTPSTVSDKDSSNPYTDIEYLTLWNFIYQTLWEEPHYLKRIIECRNTAMSYLYIALHYVTAWRKSNMRKMPYPNIEAIGFSTGDDFIEWMKQGHEFTDNMGILVCKDMQLKIQALGVKVRKNKKRKLVFEFGMLQAKTLGFLLCICESHRRIDFRIAQEKGYIRTANTTDVIADIDQRLFWFDEKINAEVTKILNGQCFRNKRGTKSFGNYILAKSEEGKHGIGYFIVSVMRSHTLDEKLLASVSQKYLKPNVNGTIDDICLTLFDRGVFGFAKHLLLSMVDPQFDTLDLKEQTSIINELAVSTSDIETACQAVQSGNRIIHRFITKAIVSPNDAIKVLNTLAYGSNCSNHKHTKCLLRAVLSSELLSNSDTLNLGNQFACLREKPLSCIGCPMLIQTLLFMTEFNKRFIETQGRLLNAQSQADKEMYSKILYTGYVPLMLEIEKEFGKSQMERFVDTRKITKQHRQITKQGKRI